MNYEFYEYEGNSENTEMLENGVLLEHFFCEKTIAEIAEECELYGSPEYDSAVWEKADDYYADSVFCELYVAELLLGNKLSVQELRDMANKRKNNYNKMLRTQHDVGRYLEACGISLSRVNTFSPKGLCEALDNGEKIICNVSGISLYYPELCTMPGLSGDCYVQVIGIDTTNPERKTVIINNPCADSGATEILFDTFNAAWQKSGCYAVVASNGLRGS